MRAFVAIFPPMEVREELLRAAHELHIEGNVRWVRPEKVHLTLKFLGETPPDAPERLGPALGSVCAAREPFTVEPSGFGAFPSERRARILWAGVDTGGDRLRSLAESVEDALEPLGFEQEGRDYTPHLTLGRARKGRFTLDAAEPGVSTGFLAERVDLVESLSGGAGYSTLDSYPLLEGGN